MKVPRLSAKSGGEKAKTKQTRKKLRSQLLAKGWTIREIPRRKPAGRVDKMYYCPTIKQPLRSLKLAVIKMQEMEEANRTAVSSGVAKAAAASAPRVLLAGESSTHGQERANKESSKLPASSTGKTASAAAPGLSPGASNMPQNEMGGNTSARDEAMPHEVADDRSSMSLDPGELREIFNVRYPYQSRTVGILMKNTSTLEFFVTLEKACMTMMAMAEHIDRVATVLFEVSCTPAPGLLDLYPHWIRCTCDTIWDFCAAARSWVTEVMQLVPEPDNNLVMELTHGFLGSSKGRYKVVSINDTRDYAATWNCPIYSSEKIRVQNPDKEYLSDIRKSMKSVGDEISKVLDKAAGVAPLLEKFSLVMRKCSHGKLFKGAKDSCHDCARMSSMGRGTPSKWQQELHFHWPSRMVEVAGRWKNLNPSAHEFTKFAEKYIM